MFLIAALLALASALVPALFPTGSASTRLIGSAFDPTTSAVALRGRSQVIVHAEAFPDEGLGRAVEPGFMPLPAMAPREALRLLDLTAANVPPSPALPMAPRHVTQAQPRAPPYSIA